MSWRLVGPMMHVRQTERRRTPGDSGAVADMREDLSMYSTLLQIRANEMRLQELRHRIEGERIVDEARAAARAGTTHEARGAARSALHTLALMLGRALPAPWSTATAIGTAASGD